MPSTTKKKSRAKSDSAPRQNRTRPKCLSAPHPSPGRGKQKTMAGKSPKTKTPDAIPDISERRSK
jgi:hypothetical protein